MCLNSKHLYKYEKEEKEILIKENKRKYTGMEGENKKQVDNSKL